MNFPDGEWYCHIDDAGGVRLYDSFDDAVNGGIETALTLISPSSPQEILVHTRNGRYRCYSQMRTWELTTERRFGRHHLRLGRSLSVSSHAG